MPNKSKLLSQSITALMLDEVNSAWCYIYCRQHL